MKSKLSKAKQGENTVTDTKTTPQRLADYLESLAKDKSKPEVYVKEGYGSMITLSWGNFGYRVMPYSQVPKEKLLAESLAKGLVKCLDGTTLSAKPDKGLQVKVNAGLTFFALASQLVKGATADDVKAATQSLADTGKWNVRSSKSGYPFRVTLLDRPNGAVKTGKLQGDVIG